MRIGFFGDSYCDLIYFNDEKYRNDPSSWGRQYKPWSGKLLEDFDAPVLSSGLGGSCLFDSITKWQNDSHKESYDIVFWSLTWHDRLYTSEYFKPVFLARAERRPIPNSDVPGISFQEIDQGIDLYYKYFYYDNQQRFYYEQSVKWILELPKKYPKVKFVFLPCTEYARQVAKNCFDQGVLVNFSFETLSNLETNSPGPMPLMCNRTGHLNDHNHECMAQLTGNIIHNYDKIANTIFQADWTNFDLKEIPNFD